MVIAAFFNVTPHAVSRHRVKVTGVRGHRIRGPIQASSSLPSRIRTAAELYAKGLPVKEIAEKMGIKEVSDTTFILPDILKCTRKNTIGGSLE
jgi:DNA-binding NarL/FixJ family response regulator